jgi:hypothetical protein
VGPSSTDSTKLPNTTVSATTTIPTIFVRHDARLPVAELCASIVDRNPFLQTTILCNSIVSRATGSAWNRETQTATGLCVLELGANPLDRNPPFLQMTCEFESAVNFRALATPTRRAMQFVPATVYVFDWAYPPIGVLKAFLHTTGTSKNDIGIVAVGTETTGRVHLVEYVSAVFDRAYPPLGFGKAFLHATCKHQ